MAIVEFVAIDAKAFAPFVADKSVKAFVRGKDLKESINGEVKRWSKDLDLDKFHAVVR